MKCKKTIKKRFLWWKWEEEEIWHSFVYHQKKDNLVRECIKCGLREERFKIEYIWEEEAEFRFEWLNIK